jgi:hypothetical protein
MSDPSDERRLPGFVRHKGRPDAMREAMPRTQPPENFFFFNLARRTLPGVNLIAEIVCKKLALLTRNKHWIVKRSPEGMGRSIKYIQNNWL